MAGACGSCTLCCKVLGIAELKKPADRWCSFCKPGVGCKIYDRPEKPPSCDVYACVWLQSQEGPVAQRLSPELRPDRCKVVLTCPEDNPDMLMAHVDPGFPSAWQDGAIAALIHTLSRGPGGLSFVVKAAQRFYRVTDGLAREIEMTPEDEHGQQQFVRYK